MDNTYKIGDLAYLLGVSTEMVRKYERLGLLESQRECDGKDRLFGSGNIQRALLLKMYRRMGVPLQNVCSAFTGTDVEVTMQMLDSQIQENKQEIADARRRILMAEGMIRQIEVVKALLECMEICESPEMIVLNEQDYLKNDVRDLFHTLSACMPIANFSHIMEDGRNLNDTDMQRGLCISVLDAKELGVDDNSPYFMRIPSSLAIHTVIRIRREMRLNGMLPFGYEKYKLYAEAHGYQLSGRIIGRSLFSWFTERQDGGFVESWFFVKKL